MGQKIKHRWKVDKWIFRTLSFKLHTLTIEEKGREIIREWKGKDVIIFVFPSLMKRKGNERKLNILCVPELGGKEKKVYL
ncbi:hypothetical protein HanPSC8_Chr15g0682711 [Helianthus annuus]|nr:hypothetical protein HanPSC8_Chr15g0682711 [Helianthus annuus]